MAHLLTALMQQYVKRGKVPPTADFGEFAPLLGQQLSAAYAACSGDAVDGAQP
jgi:hypothetical protein